MSTMSVATLDTLAVVKQLKAAGFTDDQAEAVTRVVRESQDVDLSHLVTKADLKAELAELKSELLKWVFGIVGFQAIAILGAVVTLIRLGGR